MELQKLIEKYEKEWNKYGMGAVISYSELITDLKAVENLMIKTPKNAPLADVSKCDKDDADATLISFKEWVAKNYGGLTIFTVNEVMSEYLKEINGC